jgi:predicted transcriptional regulator
MARGAKVPPELHELEAEIMAEVWDLGEATVREVLERLNERTGRSRAYTTVMTTMARLHGKGLLARTRRGKTDVYRPTLDRDAYQERRAAAQVDQLVGDYGDLALVNFARAMDSLDPARLRELRRLARRG